MRTSPATSQQVRATCDMTSLPVDDARIRKPGRRKPASFSYMRNSHPNVTLSRQFSRMVTPAGPKVVDLRSDQPAFNCLAVPFRQQVRPEPANQLEKKTGVRQLF